MLYKEIITKVGFADEEILSCKRTGVCVSIDITAWNSKTLYVNFGDAILVQDYMPGDVSRFCVHEEETDLLKKALAYFYDSIPVHHLYKHYVFLNNEGCPCLDVVAANMEIVMK